MTNPSCVGTPASDCSAATSRPAVSIHGSTSRRLENSQQRSTLARFATADVNRILAERLGGGSIVAEATQVIIGLAIGLLLSGTLPRTLLFPWIGVVFVVTYTRFRLRRHYAAEVPPLARVPGALRLVIMLG